MLLLELFKKNPDKLIKSIAKMFSDWSGHLHLAHTKQMHRDKNDHFKLAEKEFRTLQRRHHSGEDVTDKLKAFKKQIRSSVNNI